MKLPVVMLPELVITTTIITSKSLCHGRLLFLLAVLG